METSVSISNNKEEQPFIEKIELLWREVKQEDFSWHDKYNQLYSTLVNDQEVEFASFPDIICGGFSLASMISMKISLIPSVKRAKTFKGGVFIGIKETRGECIANGSCNMMGLVLSKITVKGDSDEDVKEQIRLWANDCYKTIQISIRDGFKIKTESLRPLQNLTMSIPEDEIKLNIHDFAQTHKIVISDEPYHHVSVMEK